MTEESGAKKVHDFLRARSIGYEFTARTLYEDIVKADPETTVTENIISGFLWHAHKAQMIEIMGMVPTPNRKKHGRAVVRLYRLIDHGDEYNHHGPSVGSVKGRKLDRAKKVEPQPEYPVVDTKPGLLDVKPEPGPARTDATGKPVLLSDRLFDLAVEVAALEGRVLENVATDALVEELAKRFKKEKP